MYCAFSPSVHFAVNLGNTVILCYICCKFLSFLFVHFTGSPNCPTINTTVDSTSLTVSIQKTQMTRLTEWYSVQVLPCNDSMGTAYNSTLKDPALFHVASLQPDTVYNIFVIPCNMAECNESCEVHFVQIESDTAGATGDRNNGYTLLLCHMMCDFCHNIEYTLY